jgi:hypothetical protein
LAQRRVEDGDLVVGRVGSGVAGPQQAGRCLLGAVEIGEHGVKAEPALEGAGRAQLVRMRNQQRGVDVDHDQARARATAPRTRPRLRACGPDALQRVGIGRDLLDQPIRGRVRGHRPEQRLLIAAVRDRIVQAAAKIVIEPIFEADMLECSFGFRPRRSQHDALQVLVNEAWSGKRWVLESDVANSFEAIPHPELMSAIEERIVDRQLLKLLRAMLRAGVMQDGAVKRDVAGTPQGGVISPLLCNVYLHRLDRQWTERGTGVLVRFADDMVVMCRTRQQAERGCPTSCVWRPG